MANKIPPLKVEVYTDQNEDDADETVEIELPAKYEVCPRCNGTGTHVNPAVDGNGLTQEDLDEDPDFKENYFAGAYDITCEECKGARLILVPDEERCDPADLKRYRDHQEFEAQMDRERAHELRMGC